MAATKMKKRKKSTSRKRRAKATSRDKSADGPASFTKLPRRAAAFARTERATLVAVLGEYDRAASLVRMGTSGSELHHYEGPLSFNRSQPSSTGVWAWGADGDVRRDKRKGRFLAVRDDGVVVTEGLRGKRDAFDVWEGTKKRKTVVAPDFGIRAASGRFVHDRLCLTSEVEGVVAIDVDTGERLWAHPVDGHERPSVAPAPDRAIAISDGRGIALHDVDTGELRRSFAVASPLHSLVVSASGERAIAAVADEATGLATAFALIDMSDGSTVTTLGGARAIACDAAFVLHATMLATASEDRIVRLWDAESFELCSEIDLAPMADVPKVVAAWDAHDAMAVAGSRGLVYVFALSADAQASTGRAAKVRPRATPRSKAARKRKPREDLPPREWPTRGFTFVLGKKGEDQFGGVPAGVSEEIWPNCADCAHPMIAVISLSAHPDRLPLRHHDSLAIFVCEECESFDPDGGSNAALLVSDDPSRRIARPPGGVEGETPVIRRRALVYTPVPDESRRRRALPNKVGGEPDWLQGDETPRCRICRANMRFAVQLSDRLDKRLNFADGMGYAFVCPDEHDARFLWQC